MIIASPYELRLKFTSCLRTQFNVPYNFREENYSNFKPNKKSTWEPTNILFRAWKWIFR